MQLQLDKQLATVVDKLSFSLFPGKTLALVGESGCGKTLSALSLLRLCQTPPVLPPTGFALYKGNNLLTMPEKNLRRLRGGKIGMIFQDPSSSLNPVYLVGTQLMESARLHLQCDEEEGFERIVSALQEVGIADPVACLERYPHQLSGGMKQRVMIAMALLGEPDILIADEPTTALDVTIQAQVLDQIRLLQKKKDMALLLITHDMGVVAESADEVVIMYAGQDMESANIFTLFDRMAHPYTQGLFRSRPKIGSSGGSLQAIKGSVPPVGTPFTGCRFAARCPYAMEACVKAPIPLFEVEKAHTSRCLLWEDTEESLNQRERFYQ